LFDWSAYTEDDMSEDVTSTVTIILSLLAILAVAVWFHRF